MDQTTALWLFAGAFAANAACFGFVWRCHAVNSKAIEKLAGDLSAYKLHVAEHFTSLAYAAAIEHRTAKALEDIKTTLASQDGKLDRLMEGRAR